jgi:hypothetical protein
MLGRKKAVIVSLLLAYAIAVPVFAYVYFYRTEATFTAGIILRTYDTPTMKLGFYWDETCTQNVTSFDFGNITHPNQVTILWKRLFIRNEGTVWNDYYWNSTLSSFTTEIAEYWCYDYGYDYPLWDRNPTNGTRIQPNQVFRIWYGIMIPAYATIGTYNWTLTVWGENYY